MMVVTSPSPGRSVLGVSARAERGLNGAVRASPEENEWGAPEARPHFIT